MNRGQKFERIKEVFQKHFIDLEFDQDIGRRRYSIYVKFSIETQNIFRITYECLDDHNLEVILNVLRAKMPEIEQFMDNPIILKTDLRFHIDELG